MDRTGWLLLALLAVVAIAAGWLCCPWSPLSDGARGTAGVTWRPSEPYQRMRRGGLFHPPAAGENRTGLIEWGWDWIARPPSEAQQVTPLPLGG